MRAGFRQYINFKFLVTPPPLFKRAFDTYCSVLLYTGKLALSATPPPLIQVYINILGPKLVSLGDDLLKTWIQPPQGRRQEFEFLDFQNFQKSNFDGGKFLKIWSLINLPWGHARFHKNCGPDRFSRFDVYWIQTNRQTDKLILYKRCQKNDESALAFLIDEG